MSRLRLVLIGAWMLAPLIACGVVIGRQAGEGARTEAVVTAAVADLERAIQADCGWYHDVGTAPVPANSTLGRRFILRAREAYEDRRCASRLGPLPPVVTATPTPTPGR